jgi:hypothetical protein
MWRVTHIGEIRNAEKFSLGKGEMKETLEIPKSKEQDNIKIYV